MKENLSKGKAIDPMHEQKCNPFSIFFSGDLSAFSFDYCQKPYMVSSTSLALFLSVTLYILKVL